MDPISISQAVALALLSAVAAIAVAWGVVTTKVNNIGERVGKIEVEKCDKMQHQIDALKDAATKCDVAARGLEARVAAHERQVERQADSMRGELMAMESRVVALIRESFDALRRELNASGALRRNDRRDGGRDE